MLGGTKTPKSASSSWSTSPGRFREEEERHDRRHEFTDEFRQLLLGALRDDPSLHVAESAAGALTDLFPGEHVELMVALADAGRVSHDVLFDELAAAEDARFLAEAIRRVRETGDNGPRYRSSSLLRAYATRPEVREALLGEVLEYLEDGGSYACEELLLACGDSGDARLIEPLSQLPRLKPASVRAALQQALRKLRGGD